MKTIEEINKNYGQMTYFQIIKMSDEEHSRLCGMTIEDYRQRMKEVNTAFLQGWKDRIEHDQKLGWLSIEV